MESPFSWNVRYLSKGGFACQLTARAEDSKALLEKIAGVEKWLIEQGCTPAGPEASPVAAVASAAQASVAPAHPEGWCSIHGVQMTKNERDGRSWWSHRTDSGWCKGRTNGNSK